MVNEEILGGLKSAVSRGESLRKAMITFYNSGYKKEEIEEAARALQTEQIQVQQPQSEQLNQSKPHTPIKQPVSKPVVQKQVSTKIQKSLSKVSNYGVQPPQPTTSVQQVSNYNPSKKPIKKWMIFLIAFVLFIAAGALVSTLFFKEQFIELLNNLF